MALRWVIIMLGHPDRGVGQGAMDKRDSEEIMASHARTRRTTAGKLMMQVGERASNGCDKWAASSRVNRDERSWHDALLSLGWVESHNYKLRPRSSVAVGVSPYGT